VRCWGGNEDNVAMGTRFVVQGSVPSSLSVEHSECLTGHPPCSD